MASEDERQLHRRCAHPAYEYAIMQGPRKAWDDIDVPPEGDGWERNVDAGRDGWERFDYHEESYWRRPRPGGPRPVHAPSDTTGWFHLPPAQAGDRVRVRCVEGHWEAVIERTNTGGATIEVVQVPESATETKSDGTTLARVTWTDVR